MRAKHNLYLFDGVKAQSLDNLDQWLDAVQAVGTDEHDVYRCVPWVHRCVALRANAVSTMPRSLRRGDEAVDYPLDYLLPRLLWATEAALCVYGAAYWLRLKNRAGVEGYRWLVPTSVRVVADDQNGLTGFERVVGTTAIRYKPEQIVYFWTPNLAGEVGPGISPVRAGLTAANLGRYANDFAAAFFQRGAIPAVLLTVEGNPPAAELARLEEWWKRLLQGVRRAWETIAVRATVKPQVIGSPLKDLAMTELTTNARQQIAVALGIPQTLIEDSANYATALEHRKQFYENTIMPECELIASALNEQVFKPQGMEFSFTPQDLNIFQEDENARAASLKILTEAGIPLVLAMQMLGYYLPEGWDYERLEATLNPPKESPPPTTPEELPQAEAGPEVEPQAGPEAGLPAGLAGELLAELRRWKRKSAGRGGRPVDFESDAIPQHLAELIRLAQAELGAEVWGFLKAAPDQRAAIEREIKRIVGEVFAQRAAEIAEAILAGREPDLSGLSEDLRAKLQPVLARIVYEVSLRESLALGISFDPARLNAAAIAWAQKYTYDLVKGLTETTLATVRDAITQFTSTPGMTIGDVEALLEPAFGERRAEMIAVTETTRAYSEATNEYQELLEESGLRFERVWQTSNDEKVCPICGPLHGQPESEWPDEFQGGPPAHVSCRCFTTLRVVRR